MSHVITENSGHYVCLAIHMFIHNYLVLPSDNVISGVTYVISHVIAKLSQNTVVPVLTGFVTPQTWFTTNAFRAMQVILWTTLLRVSAQVPTTRVSGACLA